MDAIQLALLMQPEHRAAADIEQALAAAARLGLQVTGHGRASIAARASPAVFDRLFGAAAVELPGLSPGSRDAGRPAGWAAAVPLPVPTELADLVSEITVTPPAFRL